jgi:hypothetical protein
MLDKNPRYVDFPAVAEGESGWSLSCASTTPLTVNVEMKVVFYGPTAGRVMGWSLTVSSSLQKIIHETSTAGDE